MGSPAAMNDEQVEQIVPRQDGFGEAAHFHLGKARIVLQLEPLHGVVTRVRSAISDEARKRARLTVALRGEGDQLCVR